MRHHVNRIFLPVAGGLITVVIEPNELIRLHASTPPLLATAIARDASRTATAIWVINGRPRSLDFTPVELLAMTINADGVVLHTPEDVIVALVCVPWDVVGEALRQTVASVSCGKRGR